MTHLARWTHNGFHGRTRLACRVPADAEPGTVTRLPESVAARLNRMVCSSSDCRCAETVTMTDYSDPDYRPLLLLIPQDGQEIRGSYPQD
uniref:Uncharacterized protein n=1 Tax=viral metagenome TaxID=1070528 RepID=A0A6M3L258_9ZZZZ